MVTFLAVLMATTGAAATTLPADLAFVRGGNAYLLQAADGNVKQITRHGGCSRPAFSPDGRALVVQQRGDLAKVDLATGKVIGLTQSGDVELFAVHPQRTVIWYVRWVVYRKGEDEAQELWRVSLDGKARERVRVWHRYDRQWLQELDDGWGAGPCRLEWRPDGLAVAYGIGSLDDLGCFVQLLQLNGAPAEREFLPRHGGAVLSSACPTWSPDGRRMAWVAWSESAAQYFLGFSGIERSITRRIPIRRQRSEGFLGWPTWSPDGRVVAFHTVNDAQVADRGRIEVCMVDSGTISQGVADGMEPCWRPSNGAR